MSDTNVQDVVAETEAASSSTTQPQVIVADTIDVQPVEDPNSGFVFKSWPGSTLVMQLPDETVVAISGFLYLLPGAPDETHRFTSAQMASTISYIKQNYNGGEKLEDVAAALRRDFIKGNQKDWNIVGGFTAKTRQLTAHEDMSDAQLTMLTDTIIPALSGEKRHWDVGIANKIQQADDDIRKIFIKDALQAHTKGDVMRFMAKFTAVFGRPKQQSATQTAIGENLPEIPTGIESGDERF